MQNTVDFGFSDVPPQEKAALVDDVFSTVAPYYDRMNDVMSLGAHRLWKHTAALLLDVQPDMRVLDIAAGSGDMSARIARRLGPNGRVVMSDINAAMLAAARRRPQTAAVQCDGESLPFAARSFDRAVNAFGLRNITARERALAEMHRVLKIGGKCAVLEFTPAARFRRLHHLYLRTVLPLMGRLAANDAASYRYLGESILRFPAPTTLVGMLRDVGFTDVRCHQFAAGAVALYCGRRGN